MTYDAFRDRWGIDLNPQQAAAVQAVEGPVLLLAVPGSGKTTVLLCRLGYMVLARGIPPEAILTTTYTVSATRDMRERFAALFGPDLAARMEFRTINGLSARIIRRYEQQLGRTAFELITDEGKLTALVGELTRKATGEFATESTIKTVRTAITYIKNMELTGEEVEEHFAGEDLPIPALYRAYSAALRRRGWMDYDDQMVYAAQILKRHPDILSDFQRRYRYLCVDEAQDTSKIQHTILRLLAGPSPNLFMVGDEDQSIYGFRAAWPQALLEFDRVYPGARVLFLERNYRCQGAIVAAAARFIRQNSSRREKAMTAHRASGPAVQELWAYDRGDQYKYLLTVAKDPDRETAVLYRNHDSALPVLDLLDRHGVGYTVRQGEGTFFSHRVVRDVLDVFALSRDPADGDAFLRVYYKFRAGITKAAAEKAVRESGGATSIFQILADMDGLSQWSRMQCQALHTHLMNMRTEPADRAVFRLRHYMGYGDYLTERGGDTGKLDILEALGRQEKTMDGLERRLEELQDLVRTGSGHTDSRFLLSTIHASKGLEYDRVILLDVADGILPAVTLPPGKTPDPAELAAFEEERRLFYVAMTRARDHLSIFRFKKPGLLSTFSADLFPQRQVPKPLRANPKPSQTTQGYSKPKSAAGPDVGAFAAGVRVVHRTFGPGRLVNRLGDIGTILFDSGEEKRFSVSTAARQGQLKIE